MIVLLPVATEQTISIMPRTNPHFYRIIEDGGEFIGSTCLYANAVITLTRDGDKESETIYPTLITVNGYYVDMTIQSSILSENETYYLEVVYYGSLWYRDKVYVTAQNDYTIKHEVSIPNYTPYDETDDNTYII